MAVKPILTIKIKKGASCKLTDEQRSILGTEAKTIHVRRKSWMDDNRLRSRWSMSWTIHFYRNLHTGKVYQFIERRHEHGSWRYNYQAVSDLPVLRSRPRPNQRWVRAPMAEIVDHDYDELSALSDFVHGEQAA